jgi:diamine N-acetyltransferase
MEMYDGFEPAGAAFGLPPPGEEARRRWIGSALGQGMNLAAFSTDGAAVGHAFLVPGELCSAELAVFVRQEFRGRGVGTALVKALLDRGTSAGLRRDWALTGTANLAARRMLEKCGFGMTASAGAEAELEIRRPSAPLAKWRRRRGPDAWRRCQNRFPPSGNRNQNVSRMANCNCRGVRAAVNSLSLVLICAPVLSNLAVLSMAEYWVWFQAL